MRRMYFVSDTCPFCGYGRIGFLMCADNQQMVLMCDECGLSWVSPQSFFSGGRKAGRTPREPDFIVPMTTCSIRMTRWATLEQIEAYGWLASIVGSKELRD